MRGTIRTQQELDRLNIQTAWQFADRMTAAAFEELCRVTMQQVHREAGCPDSCHTRAGLAGLDVA